MNSNVPYVVPDVEKPKVSQSGSAMKKNTSHPNILATNPEVKSIEEKQPSIVAMPNVKPSNTQPILQQPLQSNNQTNRLVAEVKPMQSTQHAITPHKQADEMYPSKPNSNDDELRNETVKKAAEKFEKETLKANNRGRGSGAFGAYRERSKSIGNSLAQRISTDIEDVDYDDDSVTTSSSMLPWANDNNIGKSSTPAVVRKRNTMRGVGAYQLRMSKSSDSITAAKMLAEARMQETENNQDQDGTTRHLKGRQNYHQQKALRINAQNYGGAGGRGEMSKSIEKQIDVYTKTREDIRRILDAAKKCSVAQRVKLLDNQQVDVEDTSAMDADQNPAKIDVGAQASGVLKSRYITNHSNTLLFKIILL